MAVDFKETMKYGAKILGYVVLVALISGIFAIPGMFLLPEESAMLAASELSVEMAIGGILSFIGFLIFVSGMFGIQYKIISDGVETGSGNITEESEDVMEKSESTSEEPEDITEDSEDTTEGSE